MTKIKNLLPPSIRLNVMVICETVVLLSLALGVLLYFSHRALRQEAIHDAEETLDATVQHTLCKRHAKNLGGDLILDTSYNLGCRFILGLPR